MYTAFSGTNKRRFSKTVLTVESLENVGFSCARAETDVLEYDDVITLYTTKITHPLYTIQDAYFS